MVLWPTYGTRLARAGSTTAAMVWQKCAHTDGIRAKPTEAETEKRELYHILQHFQHRHNDEPWHVKQRSMCVCIRKFMYSGNLKAR